MASIDWNHQAGWCSINCMSMSTTRMILGAVLQPFNLASLAHGSIRLPDPKRYTHLQFRRFAGCPVCNFHLRQVAKGVSRLEDAGIQTVAFFHSSAELMRPHQGALPFPVVADPQRHWYRAFGVERSALAVVHPRVVLSAFAGLVTARSNPFAGGSEQGGLPADFLIAPNGTLVALKYGAHADDQWSLDEIIAQKLQRPLTSTSS